MSLQDVFRSPTFLVGAERQRVILDEFHRNDKHLSEAYQKNKPLCFSGRGYQKTHPFKAREGRTDADATMRAPMILGVADGVSQIEEFGIDPSLLPRELLQRCESIGMAELVQDRDFRFCKYRGAVQLLQDAFKATKAHGSTTVVLAIMDNSSRIHGRLQPMMAVITVGDCELLILRRQKGRMGPLEVVFHTDMQRIDGHAQTPLQLARVGANVDPKVDVDTCEEISMEVIEKGSAVHWLSAYEGDIVVLGSDGVFDNLFLDEVQSLVNQTLTRTGCPTPAPETVLEKIAQDIVQASHRKSARLPSGQLPDAPVGKGGKMDDTSVVVAEVVEWTQERARAYAPRREPADAHPNAGSWPGFMPLCTSCFNMSDEENESCDGDSD